jgi:bacteriorhodopsin
MFMKLFPLNDTLVRVLPLQTDTMIRATLIRTTLNWGWLTCSEVQFIVIQAGMVQEELRVLHLHLKAARRLASRQLGQEI